MQQRVGLLGASDVLGGKPGGRGFVFRKLRCRSLTDSVGPAEVKSLYQDPEVTEIYKTFREGSLCPLSPVYEYQYDEL